MKRNQLDLKEIAYLKERGESYKMKEIFDAFEKLYSLNVCCIIDNIYIVDFDSDFDELCYDSNIQKCRICSRRLERDTHTCSIINADAGERIGTVDLFQEDNFYRFDVYACYNGAIVTETIDLASLTKRPV